MKAIINGIEIEGTPAEMAELFRKMAGQGEQAYKYVPWQPSWLVGGPDSQKATAKTGQDKYIKWVDKTAGND